MAIKKKKREKKQNGETLTQGSAAYKVVGQSRSLAKKGVIQNINQSVSTDYVSQALLQAYGCSLASGVENKTDYSLIETQTDTEEIQNENIFDSNAYSNLKNKNIEALDKFPNKDDPFYDLDDGLTQKLQQKRNRTMKGSEPDLVELAGALVTLNTT